MEIILWFWAGSNIFIRKIFNSHLFWLNSHPARLNQVLDTPDVQVQEPLVVVKKRGRVREFKISLFIRACWFFFVWSVGADTVIMHSKALRWAHDQNLVLPRPLDGCFTRIWRCSRVWLILVMHLTVSLAYQFILAKFGSLGQSGEMCYSIVVNFANEFCIM
jgi:hypothetical protein